MSHYGRKGKEPYHYPPWVREKKDLPPDILRDLEIAKKFAAIKVERLLQERETEWLEYE